MKGRVLGRLVGHPVLMILMAVGPATAGCASDTRNAGTTTAEQTGTSTLETTQQATDAARTDAYRNPTDMYWGFRASELIDEKVENSKGENLGEIEDLVVNLNTGDVRYAVLDFGGFLGVGNRLFAIPAKELKFNATNKDKVILDIDKARLENAKYIETDRNRWPKDWNAWDDIATVSGTPVTPPSDETARAYRGSELIGKAVEDPQGKNMGKIKDLVVDLSRQKVHYTVMAFDPSFVSPDKLIAFPVTAFQLDATKDKLVLNTTKEKLMQMPGFAATSWPDINDPAYVSEVHRDMTAYPNVESPTEMFTRLDINKDGYLSMDEAAERVTIKNSWVRLDQDHDDRVSQEEFKKYY